MVKFCTSHSSLIASMWELLWGSGLIIITHWSQPKRRLLVRMWLFPLLMNFLSLSDLCDVKILSTNGKTNYIEYLNNLTLQLHGAMIDGPANWPQALLTRTPPLFYTERLLKIIKQMPPTPPWFEEWDHWMTISSHC